MAQRIINFSFFITLSCLMYVVAHLKTDIRNLQAGITDYNYIAGSLHMPQIGQTPDGKVSEGAHGIMSDEYLKEREKK